MGEAVFLKKDSNILLDSYVKSYLNSKYIYLPVRKGYKLKVKDNTYVYKNDIVMMNANGHSVHSSISGKVLGVKKMLYAGEKKIESLVIENDFKENIRVRKSAKKYLDHYNKKAVIELLEDISYQYKGEYTIDKLQNSGDELLINGVELEPYFGNKYFILNDYAEEILETVDLFGNLFEFKKIVLAIKNTDSEIVSKIMSLIGTYPNIELTLVSGAFPNGLDTYLAKKLSLEKATVLDVREVADIYDILKKQVPETEQLITISGNAVSPTATIKVKIGADLSEVFINNFDFTKECVDVYLNGIMTGEHVDTLRYVVDSNIDGIIIMEKTIKEEAPCIKCGLCSKNCPMGLNPKYVFDHNGNVKEEYKKDCINCGLCNYSCPSNIDLRKYMQKKEHEVNE